MVHSAHVLPRPLPPALAAVVDRACAPGVFQRGLPGGAGEGGGGGHGRNREYDVAAGDDDAVCGSAEGGGGCGAGTEVWEEGAGGGRE